MRLLRYNPPEVKPATVIAGLFAVVFPDAKTAVDLTPGRGHFWNKHHPVEVTMSPHDFRELPYENESFDVCLYDPPHLGDLGAKSIMRSFGTYPNNELESVIKRGASEAYRVSRLGVICKVTDHVHGQLFVHESAWVTSMLGTPYEIVHGLHRQVEDGKWKQPACSARSNGSTYLVYRKGSQLHVRRQNKPV